MSNGTTMTAPRFTVGLDLGDRFSQACFLHQRSGKLAGQERLRTTPTDLGRRFAGQPPMRIALEVGTHSPWVSRLLASFGHQILVANPREVRLIAHSRRKNDRFDASTLARLARLDPQLLSPIRHRNEAAQCHLAVLRARAALVRSKDCDLRRHGQKIALRGGKAAKKRAAVAVARKLAVVLHHLWRTQDTYRPLSTTEVAA